MYRYDADELETMASGIAAAIKKYSIPVDQLSDQEIWEELRKRGYKFPVSGKIADRRYSNYIRESAWWFEALHLAIQQVRKSDG
jgi:hypothetical protein